MIHVNRTEKPSILQRNENAWREALLRAETASEKNRAMAKYRHRQVREALISMFYGKCAYCESEISHVSFVHIEHWRPKSRFPENTFDWNNLLLACAQCNTAYKRDQFPGPEEGGPLLNPCVDQPSEHMKFVYDPIAKLASVYGTSKRGELTEIVLGLNRDDLRDKRSTSVTMLAALARFAKHDEEAHRLLEEAVKHSGEYAAFARGLW